MLDLELKSHGIHSEFIIEEVMDEIQGRLRDLLKAVYSFGSQNNK